jgi:TonB-linked SusC/RagA family outer membrane protein
MLRSTKRIAKRLAYLALLLFLSAGARAQISLDVKNKTVKEALKEIEKAGSCSFFYSEDLKDLNKSVSCSVTNATLEETLNLLLEGTEISFRKQNASIILLYPKGTAENEQASSFIKTSGTVVGAGGEAIIGAIVGVKGTAIGALTDASGKFSLEAPANAVLTVSYMGYKPQEISVNGRTDFRITLVDDQKLLDEVVVVGYGTQSQKLVTTSISKFKMEGVDQGNDFNPVKMLQGRVSGVNIASSSGMPGAEPNVIVRGVGSISGNSAPLYVVDGIPSEQYPQLNPNDIESMEVLKDASAAAIYGSRANTGVILITTKSGKSGKTRVDFSFKAGFGTISSDIVMANSTEYANAMQAAVDNYNAQKNGNLIFYRPSAMQETDWVDLISRDVAHSQTASVSISGGNEKTTFYTSYAYNNQEGYLIKSSYMQNMIRAKFGHKINDIFKLNMNIFGSLNKQDKLEEELTSLKVLRTAREEQPWYSPWLEDGVSYKVNGTMLTRHNPLMLIDEEDWILRRNQLSGVFGVDVTPFKGFKYTPTVSFYGVFDDESKKTTDRHDARKNDARGALMQQKDVSTRYVIDNIFSYAFDWKELSASAMLGHSFEQYEYEQFGAKSDSYANGAFPSSNFDVINAGANIYPNTVDYTGYALESYFGRLALNWDNRYILNTSLRRDGSSRFSKEARYGNFPSASFAWRVSNEDFYSFKKYVSDLKLRVSWGMTGSMAGIGNFAALSLVGAGGKSYNSTAGFQITQDAQNLTWEKSSQYNVGADIELINGRMGVNIDAFYQKTTDLLYSKPVYATTGYSTIASNIGTLANKGVELGINGKILDGDFKWSMSGNISYVKNELLSLIDDVDEYIVPASGSNLLGGTMHILKNGEAVSSWYMLKMLGIYQHDNEVPLKLYNRGVRAGDVIYEDITGDGDITDDDRQIVGKATPDFVGGVTSNMSYKGFDLSIFAQYSIGGKLASSWKGMNGNEGAEHLGIAYGSVSVIDETGQSVKVDQYYNITKDAALGYWKGAGTSNTIPRPVHRGIHTGYTYDYNVLTSTRYLEDASYFKIKTITLGYTLPEEWLQKFKVASLRVYVSADNLLTFTKYSGYDPESSYDGTPGASNYGVDFGLQPVLKTFIAGLSLKF